VKARGTESAAAFALDDWRLRRVAVAAERLAPRYVRAGDDIRIDAIFLVPRRWPRHLADVWQGDSSRRRY
jgi:putative endonuclease